jgi:hypothetical protein
MGAAEGLSPHVDQLIAYFNARKLDLPDGFFDRKTQFVINGAPFETLLSASPNDPLVLMLARGPAGYRFTVKALQHAMPDAKVERGELVTDGDPFKVSTELWLSGSLRGTGEQLNSLVNIVLRLTAGAVVQTVDATVNPVDLDKIRQARLRG